MKKIIFSSLFLSSLLFSNSKLIPIDSSLLSTDNGGIKPAIEAYSDGVGIITNSPLLYNASLNTLVFKYGEQAKQSNQTVFDYVLSNISNSEDLKLVNQALLNIPNGTICNDNNSFTINDIYTNGICKGTNVEGQPCNDNNPLTTNDVYHNGICLGSSRSIGSSCDDGFSITTNDVYINSSGDCLGSIPDTIPCDDGNPNTYNDVNVFICVVTSNSSSCYNGCSGITLSGKCDDHNRNTNNEYFVPNGSTPICVGVL